MRELKENENICTLLDQCDHKTNINIFNSFVQELPIEGLDEICDYFGHEMPPYVYSFTTFKERTGTIEVMHDNRIIINFRGCSMHADATSNVVSIFESMERMQKHAESDPNYIKKRDKYNAENRLN